MWVHDSADNSIKQNILIEHGCYWEFNLNEKTRSVYRGTDAHPIRNLVVDKNGRLKTGYTKEQFKLEPSIEVDTKFAYQFYEIKPEELVEIEGKKYSKLALLDAIRDMGIEEK